MKLLSKVVRWVLSLLLLWGIYTETGLWTTTGFFLLILGLEIGAFMLGNLRKRLKG